MGTSNTAKLGRRANDSSTTSFSLYGSAAIRTLAVLFLVPYSDTQLVGSLGKGISQSQSPLSTHRTPRTQNKCTQISMPRVGFEPTTPVFKRTKKVDDLDRAATLINFYPFYWVLL
jgi:hypothetical protein